MGAHIGITRRSLGGAAGLAGGGALSRAVAQQRPLPTIGYLNGTSPDNYGFTVAAFRDGLRELGFVEGENCRIEFRWGYGDYGRLPALARELAALGVRAIAATGDIASVRAARAATQSIPIVFTIGGDPVRFGLVASMARPGGNVTGASLLSSLLGAKRIEILHTLAPHARHVALLMNPDNPTAIPEQEDSRQGARMLGLESTVIDARNRAELVAALSETDRIGADALTTGSDPVMLSERQLVVDYARGRRIPGVYFVRQFVDAGGLVSYGPNITWMYRQAGRYIGMILRGQSPAELPVVQPTHFELVVNLQLVRALGLPEPASLLQGADDVIE